ncbi:hypothetical protein Sros01_73750 [Streptomyces roseochromogenus]|nr:hypothetical protein Sros01_73750 [Streptomyces roseochromogenus]
MPTTERAVLLDVLNSRRLETLGALLATKHGLGRTADEVQRSALTCAVQAAWQRAPTRQPGPPRRRQGIQLPPEQALPAQTTDHASQAMVDALVVHQMTRRQAAA